MHDEAPYQKEELNTESSAEYSNEPLANINIGAQISILQSSHKQPIQGRSRNSINKKMNTHNQLIYQNPDQPLLFSKDSSRFDKQLNNGSTLAYHGCALKQDKFIQIKPTLRVDSFQNTNTANPQNG